MAIATLGLILFMMSMVVSVLFFKWPLGWAVFRSILVTNSCLLVLLFITYLRPKLMWPSSWFRHSWWRERKLKPKKYQLVWRGEYWRRGLRWLGPYPDRSKGDKRRGCVYRWRFAVGPLEVRRWETKK